MLRQAADLACRVSAAALTTQGAATTLPGALATALRALGASQLRGFTTGKPLGPRYQVTTRSMLDEPANPSAKVGATVVLVSGGVESAALLSYYNHWDHAHKLYPLFVDYGQRNAKQEERAQQDICRFLDLEFSSINASMVSHQLNLATSGHRYHDPLPHRNMLLLSLAASFAADCNASNVAICLDKDDLGVYSSATLPFLHNVQDLYQSLQPPLTLLMPLIALRKHQVIKMGQQVRAPWHLTYSCAEGGAEPCGKCARCMLRAQAFEEAEVEDPLLGPQRQAE